MPVRTRRKLPMPIILAQYLPVSDVAVERIAANRLGHQHCQALAAVGGGRRPRLIVLVAQSESPSAGFGCRNSSAEIYGSSPVLRVRLAEAKPCSAGLEQAVVDEQAEDHGNRRPDFLLRQACRVNDWRLHQVGTPFGPVAVRLRRFC